MMDQVVQENTSNNENIEAALAELAHYKHMDEQGLLIFTPCKVGDKVYIIDGDEGGSRINEYVVKYFYCSSRKINRIYSTCGALAKNFRPKDIGKTVFRTLEEAKAALMGNSKGEAV